MVVTAPLSPVHVASPPSALTFTPHSSGRICGVQGMICIVKVAAIEAVAGNANKPAKMSVLVHLCLFMTRHTPYRYIIGRHY